MHKKTIVVTGASSGIGAEVTRALASDGHRLFVCARRADRLKASTENGRLAHWHQVDVADGSQIEAFAKEVAAVAGSVDALICCAGAYGPIGSVLDVQPAAWWNALQVNLFGTFMTIQQFVPLMTNGDGRIITFSGGGAFNALPRYSAYAASKAAVVRLTETFAEELQPLGIAVNGVAPGFVSTEIHDATLAAGADGAGVAFHEMTLAKLATGAVPIQVPVDCVRYLLSSRSHGLTGKTISASFDPWDEPVFSDNIAAINKSELYTMRRMNLANIEEENLITALSGTKHLHK